jgi:hypothetical protein
MLVAVAGCGGGSTSTVTVTTTVETEPSADVEGEPASSEAPESEASPVSDRTAKSGGIEITVFKADSKPTLAMVGGQYLPTSPEAEDRTIKAPQGGSYVSVTTKVLNDGKEGIDLTCSFPWKQNCAAPKAGVSTPSKTCRKYPATQNAMNSYGPASATR